MIRKRKKKKQPKKARKKKPPKKARKMKQQPRKAQRMNQQPRKTQRMKLLQRVQKMKQLKKSQKMKQLKKMIKLKLQLRKDSKENDKDYDLETAGKKLNFCFCHIFCYLLNTRPSLDMLFGQLKNIQQYKK